MEARGWHDVRKGPQAKEHTLPLEAKKDKEIVSSLRVLILPSETVFRLLTSRTVREYICILLKHYISVNSLQQQ